MEHDLVMRDVRFSPEGSTAEVLAGVSALFAPGSLHLVKGVTGSGKTTMIHLLAGLLQPVQGEILAGGEPVSRWLSAHKDRWRKKVGLVFQNLCLFSRFTALENVMLPLAPDAKDLSRLKSLAAQALCGMGLSHRLETPCANLSGGEKQRVAVARALVSSPAYLLGDEPTAHQDGEAARRIMERFFNAARSTVVVVATHDRRWMEYASAIRVCYRLQDGCLKRES